MGAVLIACKTCTARAGIEHNILLSSYRAQILTKKLIKYDTTKISNFKNSCGATGVFPASLCVNRPANVRSVQLISTQLTFLILMQSLRLVDMYQFGSAGTPFLPISVVILYTQPGESTLVIDYIKKLVHQCFQKLPAICLRVGCQRRHYCDTCQNTIALRALYSWSHILPHSII